jgi:hypothetical protein
MVEAPACLRLSHFASTDGYTELRKYQTWPMVVQQEFQQVGSLGDIERLTPSTADMSA